MPTTLQIQAQARLRLLQLRRETGDAAVHAPALFSVHADSEAKHKPQEGPQEAFLVSEADIVVYGGQAGGGKSWAVIAEALKDVDDPDFGAVIFRRTSKQVLNEGGLWDEASAIFPDFGAKANQADIFWRFPSGAAVSFAHLEHEKNKLDWQGAQIAYIGFDELTHFTETQFWYMLSRNRSKARARKRIRATCNPDVDSWVAEFIAWWIDQDEKLLNGKPNPNFGLPLTERSGVVRWFVRIQGKLEWADSPGELRERFAHLPVSDVEPKSVTFIPAALSDNKILQEKDPAYRANLLALPLVERERLLGGNWKARGEAGKFFNESWFAQFADRAPAGGIDIRYWDKAGTEGGAGARSAGVRLRYLPHSGKIYVVDAKYGRWSALERENIIKLTAELDGPNVITWVEQEPGSGGKESAEGTVRNLVGHTIRVDRVHDEKRVRWGPWSAQAEGGNVILVRAEWNAEYIREHHNADPEKEVTVDMVDASSGALTKALKTSLPSREFPSTSTWTG